MAVTCATMKKGDVYECRHCGIQIKVLKSCCGETAGKCCCDETDFTCCGAPLRKKRAK